MPRIIAILLLLCSTLYLQAQSPSVAIIGTIYNSIDSSIVSQVYVGTYHTYDGALTDDNGKFNINVALNDTLRFSSVEFDLLVIPVAAITDFANFEVYLTPTIYNINEVTIRGYTKEQIRRDFLDLRLPPENNGIDLKIPEDFDYASIPSDEPPMIRGQGVGGIGFGMLTKYQKQIKEFEEHKTQWESDEQTREAIAKKYCPAIIQLLVPLTDEQMEAFMKFCDLKEEFILQATEYEVGTAIKDCYLAFVEQHKGQ